jgi:PPK2 family polyphosphate:nucleotide phosphotransferase
MSMLKRVESGNKIHLDKISTEETFGLAKGDAEARLKELSDELANLQELMFAAGNTSLLIVLQGRDTSGKDGTIRHLLTVMNAQSTRVSPFKVPTPIEFAHDFLWRVHAQTPAKGETVIFNRSHYEDVLVVRVHQLVPEKIWQGRYEHINKFEENLTDSGAIVVKFMLHISKDEQEKRLIEREQDLAKAWKLSVGDWKEREFWDDYTAAYEDLISKCSTENAPWYVVPADKKWLRNIAITEVLVETLRPYKKVWEEKLHSLGEKMKAEISDFRQSKA